MSYAQIRDVAAVLCRGSTVIGKFHSAGQWNGPEDFLFAVRAHEHGCPVVLAHDAYFAADWFVKLEAGEDHGPETCLRQPTPAEETAQEKAAYYRQRPHTVPRLDAWLSLRRDN
jgi:hypothetical protein